MDDLSALLCSQQIGAIRGTDAVQALESFPGGAVQGMGDTEDRPQAAGPIQASQDAVQGVGDSATGTA